METTLHRDLKSLYCVEDAEIEYQVGSYRIDVRRNNLLIEIQCSSLSAIRDKIRDLVRSHPVLLVKPIIRRKEIVRKRYSKIVGRRKSPKTGDWLDLFDEFVHFTRSFPHTLLTIDLLLIDIREVRRPPRRKHWRKGYRTEDRELIQVVERKQLRHADDLFSLLPATLEMPFTTQDLAEAIDQPRWMAQKIAYVLRHCGAVDVVGKKGNAMVYARSATARKSA